MRDEGMSVDPPAARSDHLSGATGWALHRPLDHDECRHREPAADLVFQGPIEFGLAGTTTPHGAVTNAFRARDIGQLMLLEGAISPKSTITANGSVPGSVLDVVATCPPATASSRPSAASTRPGALMSSYGTTVLPPSSEYRLVLLGGFRLLDCGCVVPLPEASQRLLVLLSLLDHPASRAQVAGSLWPEATEQRAHGSLRTALWRLGAARPVVCSHGELLALSPQLAVDLRESIALARALFRPGMAAEFDAEAVIRMLSTELLPGWYDDSVLLEAERWRQLRLHSLEALSRRLTAERRFGEALEASMAAVRAEPLRESGHVAVILVHLAEGNQCEAVEEFVRYRSVLHADLGLEPTEHISRLFRR